MAVATAAMARGALPGSSVGVPRHTATLPVPAPFDLRLCLFGHGWIALAPHEWHEEQRLFRTALAHDDGAVDVEVREDGQARLALRIDAAQRLTAAAVRRVVERVAHMLRLDDDLTRFHALCRADPALRWAARRGAGRLLRSATAFEDLMKLLFTTNTTWSGTEAMTRKLVAARGPLAPSGRQAFPLPRQCPREAAFWRREIKVGYRAEAAVQLAAAFDAGRLDDAALHAEPTARGLRDRITALRGFGPYAAGQALRLFGHYEELALDSWCRARIARIDGAAKPPSDAVIVRRYAPFAPFQGLAMWLDLTAEWHGETSPSRASRRRPR